MTQRVLVAMSGGVDSSVAAALLVEHGYDVIGATLRTFCYGKVAGPTRTCCGLEGIADARGVADRLGIPHYVVDVEEEFSRDVVTDFAEEYGRGRTPNPCVRCNSYTKFRDLVYRAKMLGCDAIATGHYARVDRSNDAPRLLRGRYRAKDQSYFLWGIDPAVLPMLELPVGELTKPEVREKARTLGLRNADKPESFEICFVPDGDYAAVVTRVLGDGHPAFQPGPIVKRDGTVIGDHSGYVHFTVGQRKGLPGGACEPLYVIEIRPDERAVVVGSERDLLRGTVRASELNWLVPEPEEGDAIEVQIRHRAPAAPGRVRALAEGEIEIGLEAPLRAVTPGQSAAFYRGDVLLGGGRIQ